MAKGPSGRLVVDIEPSLKRELHASLAADGLTYKDWVVKHINDYLQTRRQPSLPGMNDSDSENIFPMAAEDQAPYKKTSDNKTKP